MARRRNLVPGDMVGDYEIVREIGRGGMASIFEAVDATGAVRVAVKVLQAEVAAESVIERFEREGQILYALRHENLCSILQLGTLDDGRPFQVMELLHGTDLRHRFEDEGMLAIHDICRIVVAACRGTGAAHSCGVVHRDLKPANIFLSRNEAGVETVKVLDFGVAKTFGEESLTPVTDIVGSPQYLAPEQLADKRRLLRETDVWALGVVLYRGITGDLPFDAPNLATLCKMILQGQPKQIRDQRPDCPEELERIVLRCLEKQPEHRFPTLDALAAALAPFTEKPERTSVRDLVAAQSSRSLAPATPSGPVSSGRLPPAPVSSGRLPSAPPSSDRLTPSPPSSNRGAAPPSSERSVPSGPASVRASLPTPEPSRRLALPSIHEIDAPASRPSVTGGRAVEVPVRKSSRRFALPLIAFAVAAVLGAGGVAAVTATSGQRASSATLRVKTQPEGASVSIDFGPQMSAAQPIKVMTDGAPHNVTIWKEGYRPETRNMTFTGDVALDVVLVPLPK